MKFLRYYGWENYFAEIVTLANGFPRKPPVDSYQYLLTKYSIDLAIGDRELDLIPAKKLGIPPVCSKTSVILLTFLSHTIQNFLPYTR